jgi:phosphoribosylglycinamide formyltransferase 1
MVEHKKIKIAIFASGAGSNAKVIIEAALQNKVEYEVALIVSNKPDAGVLIIAKEFNIPSLVIKKETFFETDMYLYFLQQQKIEFIVLAGFLWKVPAYLTNAFIHKIINIHPALLPNYGGKGMYGNKVHEAVLNNKEKESGITIHYVNEIYDDGKIIFQATCAVEENKTIETLAKKIHQLEHENYWKVINGELIKLTTL